MYSQIRNISIACIISVALGGVFQILLDRQQGKHIIITLSVSLKELKGGDNMQILLLEFL